MQRLRACAARALRLPAAERRPDGWAAASRLLAPRAGFHSSSGAADAAKGAAAAGERCEAARDARLRRFVRLGDGCGSC